MRSFQEENPVDDHHGPYDQEMLHDVLHLTTRTLTFVGTVILYYSATIPLISLLATYQEYKIWKNTSHPMSPFAVLKCYLVHVTWMGGCFLASLALLPMWASRGFGRSAVDKEASCVGEKLVAMGIIRAFAGRVVIEGTEHLPPLTLDGCAPPAPVYVANHSSCLDATLIYFVVRRFKWIVKQSVRYVPGPGNLMTLAGHIFIQRRSSSSTLNGNNNTATTTAETSRVGFFELADEEIQNGIPIMVFPQGTRRIKERLPFKNGAFKIATKNSSKIVPLSIQIPMGLWNSYYPINRLWGVEVGEENMITITVHEPIQATEESDIDELKEKCYDAIYSVLPPVVHVGDIDDIAAGGKDGARKTMYGSVDKISTDGKDGEKKTK